MLPVSSFRVHSPRTALLFLLAVLVSRTIAISCPADDSSTYTTNGEAFQLVCNYDNNAGTLSTLTEADYGTCADTCGATSGCQSFIWIYPGTPSTPGTCYLKSSVGTASVGDDSHWGGYLLGSAASISASSASAVSVASVSSAAAASFSSALGSNPTLSSSYAAYEAEMSSSSAVSASSEGIYLSISSASDAAIGYTIFSTLGKHFPCMSKFR
jgi:hypothetical protein